MSERSRGRSESRLGKPKGKASGTKGPDAFLKARCRCTAEVTIPRKDAKQPQTCPTCKAEFTIRVARDSGGHEQVLASFAAKSSDRENKPTVVKGSARVTEVGPLVPERPREPSRDGGFVLDMMGDVPPSEAKPAPTPLDQAEFAREEAFEDATFSLKPIVQPYSTRRDTIPGVLFATCPCGGAIQVQRQDLGQQTECPQCRRKLKVESTRDPQTRELIIRVRPM